MGKTKEGEGSEVVCACRKCAGWRGRHEETVDLSPAHQGSTEGYSPLGGREPNQSGGVTEFSAETEKAGEGNMLKGRWKEDAKEVFPGDYALISYGKEKALSLAKAN